MKKKTISLFITLFLTLTVRASFTITPDVNTQMWSSDSITMLGTSYGGNIGYKPLPVIGIDFQYLRQNFTEDVKDTNLEKTKWEGDIIALNFFGTVLFDQYKFGAGYIFREKIETDSLNRFTSNGTSTYTVSDVSLNGKGYQVFFESKFMMFFNLYVNYRVVKFDEYFINETSNSLNIENKILSLGIRIPFEI